MEKLLQKSKGSPIRVIAVTGGKGGTGKTTISINLATALAREGYRILLFDADLGLANIDVLLGIRSERTVDDVLQGKCTLSEACVTGPHGLRIIPGASGVQNLATLSQQQSMLLIQEFSSMADEYDFMIVDLASGISCQVIDFTHASQDIVVVICNDPSSFSDSYAVIKILHKKYSRNTFGIVVNKARDEEDGVRTFTRFQEVSAKFINTNMQYLGHIPLDEYIGLAAHKHLPVSDCFPNAKSVRAFREMGRTILRWQGDDVLTGGIQFFFEKIAGFQLPIAEQVV